MKFKLCLLLFLLLGSLVFGASERPYKLTVSYADDLTDIYYSYLRQVELGYSLERKKHEFGAKLNLKKTNL